jgi:lysophospholipase L1-like esterase
MSLSRTFFQAFLATALAGLMAAGLAGCGGGEVSGTGAGGSPAAGSGGFASGGQGAGGSAASGGASGGTGTGSGGVSATGGSGGSGGRGSAGASGMAGEAGTAGSGGSPGSGGRGGTGPTGGSGVAGTHGAGGASGSGGIAGTGGTQGPGGNGGTAGTQGVGGQGSLEVPLNPALLSYCSGSNPISCAIPVPQNGDFNVTVELGGATAATTRVQAETLRIELQPTTTPAGMFSRYTFTVNVRQEVHNVYSAPGKVLNLLFDGAAPALAGVGFASAPVAPTIFIAGDSTVCDWDPSASDAITPPTPSIERGWGQELSQYLAAPGLAIANYAVSGETAGGFYATYFPAARSAMKAGDYLFIQFGHNDQKSATDIANYQANLTKYIADARTKNVTPVIFTPVARGTGTNFAGLDQQARDLAAAQKVALVDLTNLAWAYYQTLPDKTVLFVPGQETHFTESGATQIAAIVARALKQAVPSLAPSFK